MKRLFVLFVVFYVQVFSEQIGVVGSGYVGLVLTGLLAQWGHEVVCFDIDQKKIEELKEGICPLFEPGLEELLKGGCNQIVFSNQIEDLKASSIIYVCVGTPPDPEGKPDPSILYHAIDQLSFLKPSILCIKSTLFPGTMRTVQEMLPKEAPPSLVYHPEFMREGSAILDVLWKNPIVIGTNSSFAAKKIREIYEKLFTSNPQIDVIETTIETAELIKYAWNGFSSIRLSYINELSRMCTYLSADIDSVIKAIGLSEDLLPTKQIKPGCGYGGSCLPKDSVGFAQLFREEGSPTSLIQQAVLSNQQHIKKVIDRVLNFTEKESLVSLLGVSFKANTDDIRCSPAIQLIEQLIHQGHLIQVFDPYAMENLRPLFPDLIYCTSPEEAIEGSECIIVLNDSLEMQRLDLDLATKRVSKKKIADLKNLFSPHLLEKKGFEWINLGRLE